MKSNIETRRSTNQFGIIVWQLNEVCACAGVRACVHVATVTPASWLARTQMIRTLESDC
jgi:hypothetical protein